MNKRGFSLHFPHHHWLVAGVVLLALAVRLYGVTNPLFDYHSWRQTTTATVALNFYHMGMNPWDPRVDWGGREAIPFPEEFPAYAFGVALLYRLFGVQDIMGRLASIAFGVATVPLLYLLVKKETDPLTGLFAALFYTLSPYGIYFTRTFQPEGAMVFFSVASLVAFREWLEKEKFALFLLAVVTTALMLSIKLPTLHLGLPMLFLLWRRHHGEFWRRRPVWGFWLLSSLLPIAWYAWAHFWGSASGEGSLFLDAQVLGGPQEWFSLSFYQKLGQGLVNNVLTPVGAVLFLWGVVWARKGGLGLFWFWLAGLALYFWAAASGLIANDYYLLPAVLAMAPFVGLGAAALHRSLAPPSPTLSGALAAVLFLALGVMSFQTIQPLYQPEEELIEAGQQIDQQIAVDSGVVVASKAARPQLLYAARRRGWRIPVEELTLAQAEDYRKKGARYLAVMDPWAAADPGIRTRLFRRYATIIARPGYLVLDLNNEAKGHLWDALFGGELLLLAGEAMPQNPPLGETLNLNLYWQTTAKPKEDYNIFVHLVNRKGEMVAQGDSPPTPFPTTQWTEGDIIKDQRRISLPQGIAPGWYRLEIGLYRYPSLERLPLTGPRDTVAMPLKMAPPPTPPPTHPTTALVGKGARLLGYDLETASGREVRLRLHWQGEALMDKDYTVFVHLEKEGRLLAQHDAEPAGGNFPTSLWEPGERIVDEHRLVVPSRVAPGEYRLVVGMYLLATGERLPVMSEGIPHPNDGVVLTTISIKEEP